MEVAIEGNLETVVETLLAAKERGESYTCNYKGHKLYSDTVTMDSAFLEVTGKTKKEYDIVKKKKEIFAEEEASEEEKILLDNISTWLQEGKKYTFPERYDMWEKCVLSSADSPYQGTELNICLDIMKILDNNGSLEEAKKLFFEKCGSKYAKSLVRNIVFQFSKCGPDFFEETAEKENISLALKKVIWSKKRNNEKLFQKYGEQVFMTN